MASPLYKAYVELTKAGVTRSPIPVAFLVSNFVAFSPTATKADLKIDMGLQPEVQGGINPTNAELELALKRLRIDVRITQLAAPQLTDIGIRFVLLNDGDLAASIQGTVVNPDPTDFAVVEYRTAGQPMPNDVRFHIRMNSVNVGGRPHDEIVLSAATPVSNRPTRLVGGMVTAPMVIRDARNCPIVVSPTYHETAGKVRGLDLGPLVNGVGPLPPDALWAQIDVANPTPDPTSLKIKVLTPVTGEDIVAPTAAVSAGGQLPVGHYRYAVAAEYANKNEGTPGDAVAVHIANPGQKVTVSIGGPVAPHEDAPLAVVRRHVYRSGPGTDAASGDWLRIGTVEGESGGTVVDVGGPATAPTGFADDRSRLSANSLTVRYESPTSLGLSGSIRLVGRDSGVVTDETYLASIPSAPLELVGVYNNRAGVGPTPTTRLTLTADSAIPSAAVAFPSFGTPFDVVGAPPGNMEVQLRDVPAVVGLDWLSIGGDFTRISAGATHTLEPAPSDPPDGAAVGLVGVSFGTGLTVSTPPSPSTWPDNEPLVGGDLTLPTAEDEPARQNGSGRFSLRSIRWGVVRVGDPAKMATEDTLINVLARFAPPSQRQFPRRDLRVRVRQHGTVTDVTARAGDLPDEIAVTYTGVGDTTTAKLGSELSRVRVAGRLASTPAWLDRDGHRHRVGADARRLTLDAKVPRLAAGTIIELDSRTTTLVPAPSPPSDADLSGATIEEVSTTSVAVESPSPLRVTAGVRGLPSGESDGAPSSLDAEVEAKIGAGRTSFRSTGTVAGLDESGPSDPTDATTRWKWSSDTTSIDAPGGVSARAAIRLRDRPVTSAGGPTTGPWVALRATPQVQLHNGGPRPNTPNDASPPLDGAAVRVYGLLAAKIGGESRPARSDGSPADSSTDATIRLRKARSNPTLHVGQRELDTAIAPTARRTAWARCDNLPDRLDVSLLSVPRPPGSNVDDGVGLARAVVTADRAWTWREIVMEPTARRKDVTRRGELGSAAAVTRIEVDSLELPERVELLLHAQWRAALRRGIESAADHFPATEPPPDTWLPGGARIVVDGPLNVRWLRLITWDGECSDPFTARPASAGLPTDRLPVRGRWSTIAVPEVLVAHPTPGTNAAVDVWTFTESRSAERDCVYEGADEGAPKSGVGFRIGSPLTVSLRVRTFSLFAPFDQRLTWWNAIPTTDPAGYVTTVVAGGGGWGPISGLVPSLTTWRMGVDVQMKDYRGEITIRPEKKGDNPFGNWSAGPGEWMIESSDQIPWPLLLVVFDIDSGHTFMGNTGNGFHLPTTNGIFSTLKRIYNWTYTP